MQKCSKPTDGPSEDKSFPSPISNCNTRVFIALFLTSDTVSEFLSVRDRKVLENLSVIAIRLGFIVRLTGNYCMI